MTMVVLAADDRPIPALTAPLPPPQALNLSHPFLHNETQMTTPQYQAIKPQEILVQIDMYNHLLFNDMMMPSLSNM